LAASWTKQAEYLCGLDVRDWVGLRWDKLGDVVRAWMAMDGLSAVVGVGDDGEAPTDTKERKLRLGLGLGVVLTCVHVVLRERHDVIGDYCTPQIWHQHRFPTLSIPSAKGCSSRQIWDLDDDSNVPSSTIGIKVRQGWIRNSRALLEANRYALTEGQEAITFRENWSVSGAYLIMDSSTSHTSE
jgi:hypothetical protein